MLKKIFILLAVTNLAACAWRAYPSTEIKAIATTPETLETLKSFYVAIGKDGVDQSTWTREYHPVYDSGRKVSNHIYHYLKAKGYTVSQGTEVETLQDALANAKSQGYEYLIYPKTNYWVDAFYMTCGGYSSQQTTPLFNSNITPEKIHDLDEADVDIIIYDVKTGKLFSNYNINAAGCPFVLLAYIPIGKMSPDSYFQSSLDKWLDNQLNPAQDF